MAHPGKRSVSVWQIREVKRKGSSDAAGGQVLKCLIKKDISPAFFSSTGGGKSVFI